jgi:hypothetical protein
MKEERSYRETEAERHRKERKERKERKRERERERRRKRGGTNKDRINRFASISFLIYCHLLGKMW